MDMTIRWIMTSVAAALVLVSPVDPGMAETPTQEERVQSKNTELEEQTDVVPPPTSHKHLQTQRRS